MYERILHEHEDLVEIYRSHEVTLFLPVLESFVLLFIPWYFGAMYGMTSRYGTWFWLYTACVLIFLGWKFLLWWLNVYIITTKRVIEIKHRDPFRKEVLETPLERILNVSFRTTGMFSTMFNFGDVSVKVVGLEEPIELEDIPNPDVVKDLLWEMHEQHGGLMMKPTHTVPEIAPVGAAIPYAPSTEMLNTADIPPEDIAPRQKPRRSV